MKFSERQGVMPNDVEITIRHDAPGDLRVAVADFAYKSGCLPLSLRSVVCGILHKRPDKDNYTEFPYVDDEIRNLMDSCEWFEIYDIIEAVDDKLSDLSGQHYPGVDRKLFECELNKYFVQKGIGWQLVEGQVQVRGSEAFEQNLNNSRSELIASGRATAANEIHQALEDLRRRPMPDVTGSIQHALAALECVARDITSDEKATLGAILSRNADLVPSPLDKALEKLWGFASEQGRHLREGRDPSYEEAELVVQVAAAVSRYLTKKDVR